MDILAFKFGLNTADLTAGAKAAVNSIVAVKQSFNAVARAAAPLRNVVIGVKVAGDALWKLPDQMRALKAGFDGLALPIKLAASAETTAVSFRTLVGDTQKANAALSQITKLAAATPFEFPELAGAARSLVAFGEESTTVAETLRKIGDVASGVNAPIGELATLYGKARVAGVLMTEDINQLLERGIPILQEFAKQTGRSAGEIKDMASQGQITFPMLERAFTSLTSGTGKFNGMMENASRTMEGKLSNLGDSFKGVMTAVGNGLNAALKPLVTDVSTKLDNLKSKAEALGKDLGFAIDFGAASFEAGGGVIGDMIFKSLKAGGAMLAEKTYGALVMGARLLEAVWMKNKPFANDKDKMVGDAMINDLMINGQDSAQVSGAPGMEVLRKSAEDTAAALTDSMKAVKEEATMRGRRREADEVAREQVKKSTLKLDADDTAKAQKDKNIKTFYTAKNAIRDLFTLPKKSPAVQEYEKQQAKLKKDADDKKALEEKKAEVKQQADKNQVPKNKPVQPDYRPFPAGEDVGNRMLSGISPATGGTGRRTIKGAGYRGPREEEPEEGGRRTIKGAGYRPKGEDGRGGMARTGGRASEQPKGDAALATRAHESVIKNLPDILAALKDIPHH